MKFKVFKGPNVAALVEQMNEHFAGLKTDQFHIATSNLLSAEMVIIVAYTERVDGEG